MAPTKLWFRMRQFVCKDETGSSRAGEWGRDEMWLTGIAGGGADGFKELPTWFMGRYNDGTKTDYTKGQSPTRGRTLYAWDLDILKQWPQDFSITLIPVEADGARLDKAQLAQYRRKLAEAANGEWDAIVREYVKDLPGWAEAAANLAAEALRAKVMAELAATGPLGAGAAAASAKAAESAKKKVANNFAEIVGGIDFNDDLFRPVTRSVSISGRRHTFPHPGGRHTFSKTTYAWWGDHNSSYRLNYDWQVTSKKNPMFSG